MGSDFHFVPVVPGIQCSCCSRRLSIFPKILISCDLSRATLRVAPAIQINKSSFGDCAPVETDTATIEDGNLNSRGHVFLERGWARAGTLDTRSYKPGDRIPASGIYRVEHGPHRLMHAATLLANSRFPLCRRCGHSVRFYLVRKVKSSQVLPFRSNTYLEEYRNTGLELLPTS